ncbi:MAG: response regulator [Bdellovibrionia bacterium]
MVESKTGSKSGRILIVEDEPEIRENLQMFLEFEGFQIFSASNGKEALDILRTMATPCLILLDLLMPVMTGREFLEAKSREGRFAGIPVYVVSGIANAPHLMGTVGFVQKPIELDGFLKKVKEYCSPMNHGDEKA